MKRAAWFFGVVFGMTGLVRAEFAVTTMAGNQQNPAIYGDVVVWQDDRNGNEDIYGYDLSTHTEFVICDDSSDQMVPDIYKQYVVWQDNRNGNGDIYGYNLNTGTEFVVTTNTAVQSNPAIGERSGDIIVVFEDKRGGYTKDIYWKNVASGSDIAVTTADQEQSYPDIDGPYVVWQDRQNLTSTYWDIYSRNLSSGSLFAVFAEADNQQYPAISGTVVVWQDDSSGDWDIRGKNLSTSASLTIATASGSQTRPAIYGDVIVWQDDRNGNEDIYMYRLSTAEEIAILSDSTVRQMPVVGDEMVIWQDQRNGAYDLYGFQPAAGAEWETAAQVTEGITSGTTIGAQGTDVTEEGYQDNRDVWYLFTADETARYIVSLCGSDFDTTLAVFDSSLQEIAFNDDYCGLQSQLILKGIAGKTYTIRIAGYDGTTGDYEMEIVKAAERGQTLTKLPDSSYYQGVVPYTFYLYPDPTVNNSEPEAMLSGWIEFAVYDTQTYPEELPDTVIAGAGRYIYAYQIFNGSENFLGLPQEPLDLFLMQSPTPNVLDMSAAEDPLVIESPDQTILWPGIEPTEMQYDWGLSYWKFGNEIQPGEWSWYLFLRSDLDYATVDYFRVNESIKYSSLGLPVPADPTRNIADFVEDGGVDYEDFAVWSQDFLTAFGQIPPATDLNGDGTTDLADLKIFIDNWMWEGL